MEAEIEITEAMIEAAAQPILTDPAIDVGITWARILAEEVLRCGLAARAAIPERLSQE
jgi:hypothetical protein